MNKGVLYGIGTYLLWGLFPLYFKIIHTVPAIEILGHRIVWSFLLVAIIIQMRGEWPNLGRAARDRKTLVVYAVAASLLAVNWLIYTWGVISGYVVETSLGYFINPLVNILLGVIFLRERLRPVQWATIGLAAAGVGYMTISYGRPPWISLALAFSFGGYGLVKKIASLNSLHSLTLETGILFIPAVLYLVFVEMQGSGALGHPPLLINLLLVLTGVVTTMPLLLFGVAVRSIPLSLLGMLQFISPTLQFLQGVILFGEPFDHVRMVGFSLIWIALILLWTEGFITHRRLKLQVQPVEA